MANADEIAAWKEQISGYKAWYEDQYKHRPGDRCLAAFCEINKIPWPLPEPEPEEFDFLQ
jgi:hypothetical protein